MNPFILYHIYKEESILLISIWKVVNLINIVWKLKLDSQSESVQNLASLINSLI